MKLHKVTAAGGGTEFTRFAGSARIARGEKQQLMMTHKLKRTDVEVTEVEIPKGKDGLIGFLNELMS